MEEIDAVEEIDEARLLLTEYEKLKDEQNSRIGFRDGLIYATLAVMAAVVAATLNAPHHPELLLLLPPVCLLLGWAYLVNDEKISAIGRYVRTELATRLSTLVAGGAPVFGWEIAHRSDPRRHIRKVLQLAQDLTLFCVSALTAVIVFWVNGPHTGAFMAVSVVEAATVLGLTGQIIVYADLGTGR